jgi:aryl-alcohol dehydrogenase-like predicted oxidoreductase
MRPADRIVTSAHRDYASANGYTTFAWRSSMAGGGMGLLGEVVKRGFAQRLVEASIRYVLSNPSLTTTLVGLSTLEHLEQVALSAKKGPLPWEALKLISTIQQGFVGEAR